VRFRKNTNREPVWFIESMFSGYLFAEQLINELKAHVGATELVEISQAFVPGQNVQVSQGPFQGLEALVTRFIAARDRVEILIE
jgi:transcription antitermination factor NusG